MQARSGVDAHDPELAEFRLLLPAIAVTVAPGALAGLFGRLEQLASPAACTARELHDLFLTLVSGDVALYAWHSALLNLDRVLETPLRMRDQRLLPPPPLSLCVL